MENAKELIFGRACHEGLMAGVDALAEAVGSTLGPKGRNVIIPNKFGTPHITKDGVTVAKAIAFKDEMKNAGAQLVKDVASKAAEEAGDGTTTATILTQAILQDGFKHITAGVNPVFLKKGMEKAVKDVVTEIEHHSQEVGDDWEKIRQVATISANNDKAIGDTITEALQLVKKDGLVTVEMGSTSGDVNIRFTEGMQIDKGWLQQLFVTDVEKMEASYNNVNILIVDDTINTAKDLVGIIQWSMQDNKPLVVIAHDITGDALQTLLINRLKANLAVLPIKAPNFGEGRTEILEDIAILTGGVVVSPKMGMKLSQFAETWVGRAGKVTSTKDTTLFIDPCGEKVAIEARIETLKGQIARETEEWDKEQLQKRLSKLAGGAAVIEVGGMSEVEMKEKKDRVDDALAATRAAIEEGIVAGGGSTFAKIAYNLKKRDLGDDLLCGSEERIGYNVIISSIEKPLLRICENAGVAGLVVLNKVQDSPLGFNALTEQYTDLIEDGIIDPAKVLRVALQNAASVATTLLTTSCIICEEETHEGHCKCCEA